MWPGGPKFGTLIALVDTYIVWKFQLSTSSRFGIIRKKSENLDSLPEKLLNKIKGITRTRDVPLIKACLNHQSQAMLSLDAFTIQKVSNAAKVGVEPRYCDR